MSFLSIHLFADCVQNGDAAGIAHVISIQILPIRVTQHNNL